MMQGETILNHQTLLIWNSHRSFYSILNREVNLKGKESVLTRLFSPQQTWTEFFPLRKNAKEKVILSFSFWLFIPEPLLLPLPSSFFPPSALENAPINLGNQPHKHSSNHEASFSLHIYSFPSSPRIHIDSRLAARNLNEGPKYFPRPIWSLWARAM